jgi:endonuclease YncB( thermonuclease family)
MNGIKLPITINKRKCSIAPGCNSVYSGDKVYVDGEEWTVELYEMDMY